MIRKIMFLTALFISQVVCSQQDYVLDISLSSFSMPEDSILSVKVTFLNNTDQDIKIENPDLFLIPQPHQSFGEESLWRSSLIKDSVEYIIGLYALTTPVPSPQKEITVGGKESLVFKFSFNFNSYNHRILQKNPNVLYTYNEIEKGIFQMQLRTILIEPKNTEIKSNIVKLFIE